MAVLSGATLVLGDVLESQTVTWKQGSLLGVGGDKKELYKVCDYKMPGGDKFITVFVHEKKGAPPQNLKIDHQLQYGMNAGKFFIVLHDKAAYKPYQHRFIRNDKQTVLYTADEFMKQHTGWSASWVAGDYLHDFP